MRETDFISGFAKGLSVIEAFDATQFAPFDNGYFQELPAWNVPRPGDVF